MSIPLIILQARTNSSRLPAKSLLSFRGMPIFVLAALRAANRGGDVILVTSDEPSDDLLAATAQSAGVKLFRGSLNDVLSRVCVALGDSLDTRPIVRLTGDNILPDGTLIAEVVAEFEATGSNYITTGDPNSGLPHGLAIEVTRAGCLRAAQRATQNPFDREHVTPWIRRTYGVSVFDRYASLGFESHRVTIDTFDDLMSINRVFPDDCDPVNIPWHKVLNRVRFGLFQPGDHITTGDLVLGTAQFGMVYGINRQAEPTSHDAQNMIRHAIANGVHWIDTARGYGLSENVLGKALEGGWNSRCRVVTKLSALANWSENDSHKGARAAAEVSLLQSQLSLGGATLDTVLLHRWDHWSAWGGAVADLLLEWQADGRIKVLGASVQHPQELVGVLGENAMGHVQIPMHILDGRWNELGDQVIEVRRARSLNVHARSVLLQGLLLSDDPEKWRRAHVMNHTPLRYWLSTEANRYTSGNISSLCINWVRAVSWVDGVVVGMDSLAQLRSNLEAFSEPALSSATLERLAAERPSVPRNTLNPATWSIS